jgi:hypothetical protein
VQQADLTKMMRFIEKRFGCAPCADASVASFALPSSEKSSAPKAAQAVPRRREAAGQPPTTMHLGKDYGVSVAM